MPRVLSIILVFSSIALSAQGPLFTSGIDLVHVDVSIVDDDGEPVGDLSPDDLEVYEDGELQQIRYVSRGLNTDTDRLPTHLGVLLDASASMGKDERLAKTAAIRFLNTLTYAADITLVDFDDTVRVGRYDQRDFPRLVERIRNRKPGRMTAFYDALGVYLDGAFDQDGRKVLLIYSDGYDTRSRMPFSETVDLLRASDVTVYAIGFQSNIPASDRQRERMKLGQLTEITGGRVFFPTEVEALEGIYEEISRELDMRYSLGYISTNVEVDGTWRRVEVKVKPTRPELGDVKARSRRGYYARYQHPDPGNR
jgi:Ca-activated chloride channel family protein